MLRPYFLSTMRQRPIANPILTRELRARWRSNLSSILLFCYALFLALAAGLVYASASFSSRDSTLLRQMADTGHTLFLTLSGMQIGAWMLLGPALTATTIASEREQGLLEMLQMTSLSAWRICAGKLLSVFGFVVLLMFAPLPMTALCFLLGGVSPSQFCAALALQMTTAISGLCFGLWASAWSRRATTGLTLAFGGIVAYNVLTLLIFIAHAAGSPWASFKAAGASPWQSFFLDGVWRTNPLFVFLTENDTGVGTSWLSTYTPLDLPDWLFCGAWQLLFSCGLIFSATRALWKPLDEGDAPLSKKASRRTSSTRSAFGRTSHRDKSAALIATSDRADEATDSPLALEPAHIAKRPWEIGVLSRFCARNPVLEREVRRWGRAPRLGRVVARWTRMAALLFVGVYALGLVYFLGDTVARARELFWIVISIGTLLGALLACGLGAVLFAREREAGTWEGLQLSLLSTREILTGKIVPALGVCVAFCVVFWLPAFFFIEVASSYGISTSSWSYQEVYFYQWLFSLLIAIGASWFCLTWSALISAFASRVWLAVSWSIGSLLILFVGLPIFAVLIISLFRRFSSDVAMMTFFRVWHPVFAVVMMNESSSSTRYHTTPWGTTWVFLAVTFSLGAILMLLTARRLRKTLRHG